MLALCCFVGVLLIGFGGDLFSGSDDEDENVYPDDGGGDWTPTDPWGDEGDDEWPDETPHEPSDETDIYGSEGDEELNANEDDNVIFALDGDDTVNGGEGDDFIDGGDGSDVLNGEAGDDQLEGMEGDDTLYGEGGTDTAVGGPGDDYVYGDWDDDWVQGGAGNDVVKGGAGNDTAQGDEGDDQVHGGLGVDTLLGGAGNDLLEGTITDVPMGADIDEADEIYAGEGDDILGLGSGDLAYGDAGNDIFRVGTWITGDAATIADYTAGEDQIVVNYDEVASPTPSLMIDSVTEAGQTYSVLTVDGYAIARVAIPDGAAALTVADIALVPSVW